MRMPCNYQKHHMAYILTSKVVHNRSSVHETKLKWSFFHFPTSFLTKAIISKGGFMKFLIGENYHWSSLIILRIIIISYHARIKLPQVQSVTAILESWLQSPVISLPVINAPPVYRCYQLPCHLCQWHPCVADVSVWIAALTYKRTQYWKTTSCSRQYGKAVMKLFDQRSHKVHSHQITRRSLITTTMHWMKLFWGTDRLHVTSNNFSIVEAKV